MGRFREFFKSKDKTGALDSKKTQQGQELHVETDTNKPLHGKDGSDEGIERSNTPLLTENTPIRELWRVAYEKLQEEDGALIKSYETGLNKSVAPSLVQIVPVKANKRDEMEAILRIKMDDINKNMSSPAFKARVGDFMQLFVKVVDSANDYISDAASANPYTSIAWTGVSLVLPLLLNPSEERDALAKGLDYITSLITQSRMREELYVECYESGTGSHEKFRQSHNQYKTALEKLYRQILRFQATVYCYYANTTALRIAQDSVKWNSWEQLVNEVRDQENNFTAIEDKWRDIRRHERHLAVERLQQATINTLSDQLFVSQEKLEKAKEEEYEGLLHWLSDIDHSSLYTTARDRHESGTNEWLIKDSKEFKIWETEHNSLLWLHGKAGSGKSILTSSVIKYLRDQYPLDSSPSTALAYFYFSFSDSQKQKVDGMLASLIKQICSYLSKEFLFIEAFRLYKKRGERPDTRTLEDMLMSSTSSFSNAYVVIDAIDECPLLNDQRDNLLKSLERILLKVPQNLHIFLTSRKEKDIDDKLRVLLSPPSRIEIDLLAHQETLNRDIRHYIDLTLSTSDFNSWPESVKEEVEQSLVEKADCMFQYVRFQFESLRKLSSIPKIRKALQDLPIGLDATYDKILQSIDSDFQSPVIGSLKWLAFSRRSLNIKELSEVFTIFTMSSDGDIAFKEEDRPFSCMDILKYFSGLIITHDSKSWAKDFSGYTVRLVHFSLKEYLTSKRVSEGSTSVFSFNEVDSHLSIIRSCIVYLKHLSFKYAKGFRTPLLAANSQSLLTLLRLRQYFKHEEDEKNLWFRPYCYTAWLGLCQLTKLLISKGVNEYITQHELGMGLSTATQQGNRDIMQLLLKAGADVNAVGTYGTSLENALEKGDLHALELLEKHGALENKDLNDRSLLISSNEKCMKYLLDRGADINMQTENGGIALHMAISRGDESIFNFLLERGADVNAVDVRSGTPLQEACSGHEYHTTRFAEILLDRGADPNFQGGRFGTALQAACAALSTYGNFFHRGPRSARLKKMTNKNHTTSTSTIMQNIRLLIDHGADVNIQGGEYGTALHALAGSTEPETDQLIKLLLDKGAKIDQISDADWGTALHVACHEGMIETVRLLLDNGADVNAAGGRFGTPLQAAVTFRESFGRKEGKTSARENELMLEIVKLLIERGAEVNSKGETALQAAYANEDIDVNLLRLLLNHHRADILVEGGHYETILAAACGNPNMELESVHLLLDRGVDVNAKGGVDGTALIAACGYGHIKLVQLLIDRGADVNAKGPRGQTALTSSCSRNSLSIRPNSRDINESIKSLVELLLKGGADVNAEDRYGQTPLTLACSSGDLELVKLLLENGADVFQQDCAAWHVIAQRTSWLFRMEDMLPMLKLVYEYDIDINHVHERHGTALNAITKGWLFEGELHPIIRWLLDKGANVNTVGGDFGFPLQAACTYTRNLNSVMDVNVTSGKTKLLLEQCPDIDVNAQGGILGSALQAAAISGQTESIKLLLDKKANVNAAGGLYGSALNAAIIGGYWNIVEILLQAGATPDCHIQEQPDEEWLEKVREENELGSLAIVEYERGAVERYMKFWEVQSKSCLNS